MKKIISKLNKQKTLISFSAAAMLMSITLMACNIIIMLWIKPEEIGIWNTYLLIQTYAVFLQLGIYNGLNRELPYLYGKNDTEKITQLAETSLWVSRICIYISIVVIATIIPFVIKYNGIDSLNFKSIIGIGIITMAFFYQNYLTVTYRTNKHFNLLARNYFIQTFLLIATLPIVYFFGIEGMIIRYSFLSLSIAFMLHIFRPLKVKSKFTKSAFIELFKTGFPIFGFGYIQGINKTINKVVLLFLGGTIAVGYYTPAISILGIMKMLPQSLGQYLYPKMSYELGKTGDKKKLWTWTWKSNAILFLSLIPLVAIGWFLLPWLIHNYFPNYNNGTFAAQLALISGIFSGSLIGVNILNSLKAFKEIGFLTFLKFFLNVILIYSFAISMDPLTGVALGLLISDIIYFFVANYISYYALMKSEKY